MDKQTEEIVRGLSAIVQILDGGQPKDVPGAVMVAKYLLGMMANKMDDYEMMEQGNE
jgi:hypothetical protein